MNSWESMMLGEDIKNLDLCYTGNDFKLYKVKKDYELNNDLVLVCDPILIDNGNRDDILLKKGNNVRCIKFIAITKSKII